MRAALISDTHGYLPPIPADADFIIHAGDISYGVPVYNKGWYGRTLAEWCEYHGKVTHATFGNHDGAEHLGYWRPPTFRIHIDSLVVVGGLKCWFSPWSTPFFDWRYMMAEDLLVEKYKQIPDDAQVIVSHGPPLGYGDRNGQGTWCGSRALHARMQQLQDLRLVVTGHIHEARGVYAVPGTKATVINASVLNGRYQPYGDGVMVVDWPTDP